MEEKPNPFNRPDGFSAKDGLYYTLVLQYIAFCVLAVRGNPEAMQIAQSQTAIIVAIVGSYGVHEGFQSYRRYRYVQPQYGDYSPQERV